MYKPVEAYSKFGGGVVKLYYCAAEAARDLGLSYYKMLQIINERILYNRMYFRWYYEEPPVQKQTNFYIVQKQNGNIINQFSSVVEAAEVMGIGRNIISRHIKNQTLDKWGCSWENLKKANIDL